MFWGIDQKDWLQLWSGALGSLGGALVGIFGTFLAAIIGGVVALVVVRLSNDHQERLGRQQGELQARLAAEQAEQRKAEATRIRENSLIADLIVATDDMLNALWEGREAIEAVLRRMAATITVWKSDGPWTCSPSFQPGLNTSTTKRGIHSIAQSSLTD